MASTPVSTARSEDRLLHLLGQHTLRIAELEAENNDLKAQIAASRERPQHVALHHRDVPIQDYQYLRRIYDALQAEHGRTERQLWNLNDKYATAKKRVYEWRDYAQNLKARVKSKTDAHTTDGEPELAAFDLAKVSPSMSPSAPHEGSKKTAIPQTTSSQTTICEPELEPELSRYDDDDDEPVLVSERRLKRRRLDTNRSPRIKQEGSTSLRPFVVASDEPDIPQTRRIEPEMSDLDGFKEAELANVATTTPRPRTGKVVKKKALPGARRPLGDISNNVRSAKSKTLPDNGKKPPLEYTALRSKPLEELELRDFCPNPYYTGPAMTFYKPLNPDTTRTCLPTCTRAACCGDKWRRAIEIGGAQVTGKTNAEVLEDYFGANWKEIYEAYPVERRKDFVNQAHALSFARQSGVHSKHTIRPPTPPGLWRTDMPSTQELQAYKDEAAEQEKRRIAERHHEAMREGGQWLFRDEA
ncbi:hypothetical protein AMS68_007834 [Peltaster fructicola]|uniref:DNA endonuclease activator Ctp1 C-terminal domain-containing protein n=1 Tax=Peltaster fructicola TaxID=286661 RepID=A0A6H0Y5J1_9PEZI|nr:hypothetical protein AMS68_007834 [Peltaster fructicola]